MMQRWTPSWLWDDQDDERGMPRAIMEAVDDGNWVKHSDAADLLLMHTREIEKLNARLALAVAEVRMARTWVADQRTHDGAVFATYGEYSPEYMAARAATDADPVLRAMVEKGSEG